MDTLLERLPRRGFRLGPVVAGLLVAVVLQVLLTMLGGAIGLTAFPVGAQLHRDVQIGYLVWLAGSLLVSTFAGAYVAAVAAPSPFVRDGVLHAIVTWAAIAVAGLAVVGRNLDDVTGTAIRIAGNTAQAAAPSAESRRVVAEQKEQAQNQLERAVAEVKGTVEAAAAADQAKQQVAVGLWSFLGVMVALLVAAVAGGVMGAGSERRLLRRRRVRFERSFVDEEEASIGPH